MKKINIKNNNENVIKPQKITLINEKQEKYSFTERIKLKAIVQKIINGFDKIYLIDTKDGIKKVKTIKYNNGVLITKFFQERQTYVLNSEKLEELSSIFLITNLKFKVRENYEIINDIVEFNKETYEIIGFLLNKRAGFCPSFCLNGRKEEDESRCIGSRNRIYDDGCKRVHRSWY